LKVHLPAHPALKPTPTFLCNIFSDRFQGLEKNVETYVNPLLSKGWKNSAFQRPALRKYISEQPSPSSSVIKKHQHFLTPNTQQLNTPHRAPRGAVAHLMQ